MLFLPSFACQCHPPLRCPHLTPIRCLDWIWQVFDGHNGVSAAVYSKEHLLEHVISALPPDIGRDDWLQALPPALVAGFVKADIDFQRKGTSFFLCKPSYYYLLRAVYIHSFRFGPKINTMGSGEVSGTTATLVVIDGFTVTVASVGDSRCILDTQGGELQLLTVDHRLEENAEERERVTASGGEVGRLNLFGGQEVPNIFSCLIRAAAESMTAPAEFE